MESGGEEQPWYDELSQYGVVWQCGGWCARNVDDGTWSCDVVALLWCGAGNGPDVVQGNDARGDGVRFGWCGGEEQGVAVWGEGPHEERCMER